MFVPINVNSEDKHNNIICVDWTPTCQKNPLEYKLLLTSDCFSFHQINLFYFLNR